LHPFLFLDVSNPHTPLASNPLFNPLEQQHFHFRQETFCAVRICGDVEKFLAGSWFWNGKEEMGGVPVLFLLFGEWEKLFFPTFSSSTPPPSPQSYVLFGRSFFFLLWRSLRKTYV
jgi:hypothetical protein